MNVEVKIPVMGESIAEVTLSSWLVSDGDVVQEGDPLCEIESDKANVEIPASTSGTVHLKASEGEDFKIGDVIASITPGENTKTSSLEKEALPSSQQAENIPTLPKGHPSPAAKKILLENNIAPEDVQGTGKGERITKEDALKAASQKTLIAPMATPPPSGPTPEKEPNVLTLPSSPHRAPERAHRIERMGRLRKTIATRLLKAKNSTAMVTTFNEVDMATVIAMRKKHNEAFVKKHGIKLGFMSLFTKASALALKDIPNINAQIEGENLIFFDYCDIGVAVSTPDGLVVPIIRDAQKYSLFQLELEIKAMAEKARNGKLSLNEMTGGTFTITNGGIFGSMLSTPILNPPQSAILGMHNIVERPVAYKGQVVIHPIMYLALSYDHRIVDGREAVTFLKRIKEFLEEPTRMLLEL